MAITAEYNSSHKGKAMDSAITKVIGSSGSWDDIVSDITSKSGSWGGVFAREITVAKTGGDYTSVSGALASISDNSEDNRYSVAIYPGVYKEDNPIEMKQSVTVNGIGRNNTILVANNGSSNLINMVNGSFLNGVILSGSTTGNAINITDVTKHCWINSVDFKDCYTGIYMDASGSNVIMTNCEVKGRKLTNVKVICVNAGSIDLINLLVHDVPTITTLAYSSGSDSQLNIYTISTENSNLTTALKAEGGGVIRCINGKILNSGTAIHVGTDGTINTRNLGINNSAEYDLLVDDSTGTFRGHNVNLHRDAISVDDNNSDSMNFGFDPYSNAYRVLGTLSVGKDGTGNKSRFGEGGPYTYHTEYKTYETSSAAYTSGSNSIINFPGIGEDNAMYFGDTDPYRWYGLTYTLSQSINEGTGCGIWEYYDGGASDWVKCWSMNTVAEYSDTYRNKPFTYNNVSTVRFDSHIKDGITENNISASGWATHSIEGTNAYWIRYRVSQSIDVAPIITDIELKGSYTEIRSNGSISKHGDARSHEIHNLPIGIDGTTANENVAVSTNIHYPMQKNKFASNVDDSVFWKFTIDDSVDTSCGLRFIINAYNEDAEPTETASMHMYTAPVKESDTFDSSSVVEQHSTFDWLSGNQLERIRKEVDNRINIETLAPGDTVYGRIRKNASTDGDAVDLVLTDMYIKYYSWQQGSHNSGSNN